MADNVTSIRPGTNGFNPAEAKSFFDRIEALEEQKKEISGDIKTVKKEAAEAGFPTKVINEVLRDRRKRATMDDEAWDNFENEVDQLKHALGMLQGTPLGEAAMGKVAKGAKKTGSAEAAAE